MIGRWSFVFDKDVLHQRYRTRQMAAAARRTKQRDEAPALARQLGSDLITLREFAAIARVSDRTMRRLRADHPADFPREVYVSARPSFMRQEVLAWIERRRTRL